MSRGLSPKAEELVEDEGTTREAERSIIPKHGADPDAWTDDTLVCATPEERSRLQAHAEPTVERATRTMPCPTRGPANPP